MRESPLRYDLHANMPRWSRVARRQGKLAMGTFIWIWIVVLGITLAASVALIARAPALTAPTWYSRTRVRLLPIVDLANERVGRWFSWTVIALTGTAVSILVLWIFGGLAKILEGPLDWPVLRWSQARQIGWWSDIWWVITNIGKVEVTQWATAIGTVVVVGLYILGRRKRPWIPAVTILAGYFVEKFVQDLLKLVVDRGHPPTSLGSFPSGGCARVLVVYGLIVFFLVQLGGRSPRVMAAGAALVGLAEVVQAYARLYNLEHWFTDVVAGVMFGLILLATFIWAAQAADRPESGAVGQQDELDRVAAQAS